MSHDDHSIPDDAPASTTKHDRHVEAGRTYEPSSVAGHAVTINRPPSEVYAFFRDFSNLSSFMDNVERVQVTGDKTSHWVVRAPGGKTVEWDAELTHDDGETLAWTSVEGADIYNTGRVSFHKAQGNRGTVVHATIAYDPPAGFVGKLVAKLTQREPSIQARRDLHRFKQLMETGEVSTAARNRAELAEERN